MGEITCMEALRGILLGPARRQELNGMQGRVADVERMGENGRFIQRDAPQIRDGISTGTATRHDR